MKFCHNFLVAKGHAPKSLPEFKKYLYGLWFELYSRTGRVFDSSGFEHVFLGEIKDGQVIGFHNWIQFFLEEKHGRVNYKGYIVNKKHGKNREESADDTVRLITIQFSWGTELKSVSSTLIGTSPEFEIALYTMCFLEGKENVKVKLGPYSLTIKCHRWHTKNGEKIGACYPCADDE